MLYVSSYILRGILSHPELIPLQCTALQQGALCKRKSIKNIMEEKKITRPQCSHFLFFTVAQSTANIFYQFSFINILSFVMIPKTYYDNTQGKPSIPSMCVYNTSLYV